MFILMATLLGVVISTHYDRIEATWSDLTSDKNWQNLKHLKRQVLRYFDADHNLCSGNGVSGQHGCICNFGFAGGDCSEIERGEISF